MKKKTASILSDVLVVAGAALIVGALPRLLGIKAQVAPPPPPAADEGEEAEF